MTARCEHMSIIKRWPFLQRCRKDAVATVVVPDFAATYEEVRDDEEIDFCQEHLDDHIEWLENVRQRRHRMKQ